MSAHLEPRLIIAGGGMVWMFHIAEGNIISGCQRMYIRGEFHPEHLLPFIPVHPGPEFHKRGMMVHDDILLHRRMMDRLPDGKDRI